MLKSKSVKPSNYLSAVDERGEGDNQFNESIEDFESLDLQMKLPMEFATFELLVSAAFELLHADISHLEKIFIEAKQNLEKLNPLASEELHVLKNQVQLYADRVALFDRAFEEIISNPEEMVKMELSKQTNIFISPSAPSPMNQLPAIFCPLEGGVSNVGSKGSVDYNIDSEEARQDIINGEVIKWCSRYSSNGVSRICSDRSNTSSSNKSSGSR